MGDFFSFSSFTVFKVLSWCFAGWEFFICLSTGGVDERGSVGFLFNLSSLSFCFSAFFDSMSGGVEDLGSECLLCLSSLSCLELPPRIPSDFRHDFPSEPRRSSLPPEVDFKSDISLTSGGVALPFSLSFSFDFALSFSFEFSFSLSLFLDDFD